MEIELKEIRQYRLVISDYSGKECTIILTLNECDDWDLFSPDRGQLKLDQLEEICRLIYDEGIIAETDVIRINKKRCKIKVAENGINILGNCDIAGEILSSIGIEFFK